MVIGEVASAASAAPTSHPAATPVVQSPAVVIQRVMNVVMPLRAPKEDEGETMALLKARLVMALATERDAITTGLDNLGSIHFARFNLINNDLHLISVYDGTLQGYVQEFTVQIGSAFDRIMSFVADWPPESCADDARPVSVRDHPAEFVEWVMAHDIVQIPRDPTDVVARARAPDAGDDGAGRSSDDVGRLIEDALVKQFEACPHANLSVHRGYAGRTVAQIRDALQLGW
jgi:hypothetical protein